MKNALITGICGQDGSFLAELLLEKGYNVYGTVRRKSVVDYGNAGHLLGRVNFIYADVTDQVSIINALKIAQPDEVYNLAAQSFVEISWRQPGFTSQVNGMGVLNLLEAIRLVCPQAKFYQASTSELFGQVQQIPQDENTPFYPRSPYGVSKLFGHWITKNYRESYGMFCCAGILFNHESERRGMEFVTRKISSAAARISLGQQKCVELGCLDSSRDWGYAKDYVEAMHAMLCQDSPDDFVIASGEAHTVREFAERAFACAGINIEWSGSGTEETGINTGNSQTVIKINPDFYRPAEVHFLLGNPVKAENKLGWHRKTGFNELVEIMVGHDLSINRNTSMM